MSSRVPARSAYFLYEINQISHALFAVHGSSYADFLSVLPSLVLSLGLCE